MYSGKQRRLFNLLKAERSTEKQDTKVSVGMETNQRKKYSDHELAGNENRIKIQSIVYARTHRVSHLVRYKRVDKNNTI